MENDDIRIVTNNDRIEKSTAIPHDIFFVEGTPLEVLDRTEELLQDVWLLISAPLPPNVPIMRGPYRSLIIKRNERRYDREGLIAIGKAKERYRIERENSFLHEPSEDFATIDRQMLQRALRDTMILEAEIM